jgi:hypothetical protein
MKEGGWRGWRGWRVDEGGWVERVEGIFSPNSLLPFLHCLYYFILHKTKRANDNLSRQVKSTLR